MVVPPALAPIGDHLARLPACLPRWFEGPTLSGVFDALGSAAFLSEGTCETRNDGDGFGRMHAGHLDEHVRCQQGGRAGRDTTGGARDPRFAVRGPTRGTKGRG